MSHPHITAEEAVALVESVDRVYIHGGAATPLPLINAMLNRAGEIRDVELVSISTYGPIDWNRPLVRECFYLNSLFVSANVHDWVNNDGAEYVPVFLSEIPKLFEHHVCGCGARSPRRGDHDGSCDVVYIKCDHHRRACGARYMRCQ